MLGAEGPTALFILPILRSPLELLRFFLFIFVILPTGFLSLLELMILDFFFSGMLASIW